MRRHNIDKDGDRWAWWPVSLRISWRFGNWRQWFKTHGWQIGSERVDPALTSRACMPGFRRVFGWTLHLGPLKVCFGRRP